MIGMIEIIIIAVIGTALAGMWDLKTTEVPDHIPIGLVAIGIMYWIAQALITKDWYSFIVSATVGTALLAAGLVMYKKKQWGGADAWILAAVGYMIPVYQGQIFIIPYLMNFMLVSIAYTVVYAVAVGFINRAVFPHVAKDFRQHAKIIVGLPLAVGAVIVAASFAAPNIFGLLFRLPPLILLLMLFWRYALVIEKKVFRKKIPSGKLKVGDVLDNSKWVGLTEKDIRKIRREKRFVVIKDGMRFVPVFAIALVLTLLYGNLFFALI